MRLEFESIVAAQRDAKRRQEMDAEARQMELREIQQRSQKCDEEDAVKLESYLQDRFLRLAEKHPYRKTLTIELSIGAGVTIDDETGERFPYSSGAVEIVVKKIRDMTGSPMFGEVQKWTDLDGDCAGHTYEQAVFTLDMVAAASGLMS